MIWRRHYKKVHDEYVWDINGQVKSDDDEEKQKDITCINQLNG